MASTDIIITENVAVYKDENESKILLDFRKLLSNKSRVSMHKGLGWDIPVLPEILAGVFMKEKEKGEELCLPTLLLDTLLAARLIQTSQPVRVLEYGCGDGRLSWHLAELLGTFHPESSLVCAHNAMDETLAKWMEEVYKVESQPRVSYMVGELGHLQLQRGYFNIVLINGMVNYLDPQKVILDALSLAAEDGMILCYAESAPLLEDIFKLYFEGCDEYVITPFQRVLAANASDQSWEDPRGDMAARIEADLREAESICGRKEWDRDILDDAINRLHEDAQTAAKLGKIDLKLRAAAWSGRLLKLWTEPPGGFCKASQGDSGGNV